MFEYNTKLISVMESVLVNALGSTYSDLFY